MKNALSRNGVVSPWLDEVRIIPLDKILVPEKEDLKPIGELVAEAIDTRADLQQRRINLESTKLNTAGTRSALLPSLQAYVEFTNNALTGDPNALHTGIGPDPFVVGWVRQPAGTVVPPEFPELLRRIFAEHSVPEPRRAGRLRGRPAQHSHRRAARLQKATAQVRLDVKNAVIGLQQARARYETASGHPRSGPADARRRTEALYLRRIHHPAGGCGAARPGRRPRPLKSRPWPTTPTPRSPSTRLSGRRSK